MSENYPPDRPTSDRPFSELLEDAVAALRREVHQRLEHSRNEVQRLLEGFIERLPEPPPPAPPPPAPPLPEVAPASLDSAWLADLRDSVSNLSGADTQPELMARLVEQAATFASRTVLLLLNGDGSMRSWASLGFHGAGTALEGLELPRATTAAWMEGRRHTRRLSTEESAPLCSYADLELPLQGVLVPLSLRGQVVALVYADQYEPGDRFSVEALQLLVHAAAQGLELLPLGVLGTSPTLRNYDEAVAAGPRSTSAPSPPPAVAPARAEPRAQPVPTPIKAQPPPAPAPPKAVPVGRATEPVRAKEAPAEYRVESPRPPRPSSPPPAPPDPPFVKLTEITPVEPVRLPPLPHAPHEPPVSRFGLETTPIPLRETLPAPPGAELLTPGERRAGFVLEELRLGLRPTDVTPSRPMPAPPSGLAPPPSGPLAPPSTRPLGTPSPFSPVSEDFLTDSASEAESRFGTESIPSFEPGGFPLQPIPLEPRPVEDTGFDAGWELASEEPEEPAITALPMMPPSRAGFIPQAPDQGFEASALATQVIRPADLEGLAGPAPRPLPVVPEEKLESSSQVVPPADVQGPGLAFTGGRPATSASDLPLHDEAKRLARLLVSEIKLYNEEQIEAGRRQGNIYAQLREDIDRSQQIYEGRIDARVRDSTDYFRDELVRTLAGGDQSLMGL